MEKGVYHPLPSVLTERQVRYFISRLTDVRLTHLCPVKLISDGGIHSTSAVLNVMS